jgi:hypothetical protein
MAGQIVHRILYPYLSVKDTWEHSPTGGANWERVLKEDTAHYENGERPAPPTASFLKTKAGSAKEDNVGVGKGGAKWLPAPWERPLRMDAYCYVKEAANKAVKFRLSMGTLESEGGEESAELLVTGTTNQWVTFGKELTNEKYKQRIQVCGVSETTKEVEWYAAYVDVEVELLPMPKTLWVPQSVSRGAVI